MIPLNNFGSKLKLAEYGYRLRVMHYVMFGASLLLLACLLWCLDEGPCFVPRHLHKYVQFPENYKIPEKQLSKAELKKLIFKVERLNSQAEVMNWDKYGAVHSDSSVIVIRVHKDVQRLQYLIVSLGQVRYIWRVLLIFSHSYFDDEINKLVKSINFCRVMQIFYPNSLQLYPNEFPGVDPDDCNASLPARAAPPETPAPCRERDARRVQRKQHWWWTANYVFNGEWSSDKRIVIFLEEDNFVLPDLLHILQRKKSLLSFFPTVEVMSFGGPHPETLDYDHRYDLVKIDSWTPPYENGLAFNLTTWRKISASSSCYCFYDDCRWSYSLVPVFANLSGGYVDMAASAIPRVLSTSGSASARRGAHRAWLTAKDAPLFPPLVRASVTVDTNGRVASSWRPGPRGDAGCGDLRDQTLCLDPLMSDATETTAPP